MKAKGIVVLRTVADGDLINGVMNPDFEIKTLENESSEEGIVTEKISWAKNSDAYSTFVTFANSRPCYSGQEIMQLHILRSTFLQKRKRFTKQAHFRQVLQQVYKSHKDLQS